MRRVVILYPKLPGSTFTVAALVMLTPFRVTALVCTSLGVRKLFVIEYLPLEIDNVFQAPHGFPTLRSRTIMVVGADGQKSESTPEILIEVPEFGELLLSWVEIVG